VDGQVAGRLASESDGSFASGGVTLDDGTHTISAVTEDLAGNRSSDAEPNGLVDDTAPDDHGVGEGFSLAQPAGHRHARERNACLSDGANGGAMSFCEDCGKPLRRGARYCGGCGASVPEDEGKTESIEAKASSEPTTWSCSSCGAENPGVKA
jgi:hypothetical protein